MLSNNYQILSNVLYMYTSYTDYTTNCNIHYTIIHIQYIWVILLKLVHTRNLQFLAIFHNLAGNEHVFLAEISKTSINTPE